MLQVNAEAYNKERDISISVERLGRGMKSIYMLSLLEAYVMDENSLSSIILVEGARDVFASATAKNSQ